MQPENEPRDSAVARPLIIAIVVGFIIQAIIATFVPGGGEFLVRHVVLTLDNIREWRVWTLLTYALVEPGINPWSVLSVVLDAVMIHLFARTLVPVIGSRGFWQLAAGAVVIGGLCTLGVAWLRGLSGVAFSPSTIVLALLTTFACLYPDRAVSLFFLPISIKPKHLAWFIAGVTAFSFVFFELPKNPGLTPPSNLLGGMLAGWLFHRFVHRPGAIFHASTPTIEMPAWMQRRKKVAVATAAAPFKVNVSPQSPADIRAEVDRILDKINSKGFGSLTTEERRILDEARDTLNKR